MARVKLPPKVGAFILRALSAGPVEIRQQSPPTRAEIPIPALRPNVPLLAPKGSPIRLRRVKVPRP